MVLWCALKLALHVPVLGPLGRVSGAGQSQMLPVPWFELQKDLQMAATCAVLGGAWERLSCEPRPAATSARLGAA